MSEPLVSVKMITYNHAPFIAQAIEGVLQQKTNFPFELVIGEDCSTDGTREIVFKYQQKYPDIIRVITSEKNVGMKKNGYRTTKACRGKYIALCEGDDYWHSPRKLKVQADYMEAHPECGAVHSSYDICNEDTGELIKDYVNYKKWKVPNKIDIYYILSERGNGFWIHTCTVMTRRKLHEQIIESDPDIHQGDNYLMGDTQLWAELSMVSEIVYIPESLATYRVLSESASNSRDEKRKCRFNKSNADVKLYLCKKYNLDEKYRIKIESDWYYHALRLAFYERNAVLAEEVKYKKRTFTLKEWLQYYGAKNMLIHNAYRGAASVTKCFRQNGA